MEKNANPGVEHQAIRGITIKNIIVTIVSSVTITASVVGTYSSLRTDNKDIRNIMELNNKDIRAKAEMDSKMNELRFKIMEEHINIIQQQVDEFKKNK
jgi:hypothetical protein